jgi:hypothetical protein
VTLAKTGRQARQGNVRLSAPPQREGGIGRQVEKQVGTVGDRSERGIFDGEPFRLERCGGLRQNHPRCREGVAQDAQTAQVHAADLADDLAVDAAREVGFGGDKGSGLGIRGLFFVDHAFLRFFDGNGPP